MSFQNQAKKTETSQPVTGHSAPETVVPPRGALITATAARLTAVLRIAIGFVFLWAFLDKTFGFGYTTPPARAWIHGGSPTAGFLRKVDVGPLAGAMRSWAGAPWADWLFMIGMAGVGVALLLGIGLRIAAVAGSAMMMLMWIAEWPPAKATQTGQATGSSNPIIDSHVIYALVLITLAALYAGNTWGLGRWWSRLIGKNRWLV
ncbi:DoxX family membrane protein [Amycolatopsis taiwanensis]|uniref:DoxX family membrane protein n=1 Tax=Amycolatopsis taiwanensis TaxID=342230 RepID=UPI00047FAA61|nr:DoxX family membrane protein [Amycolatopsis taiwanensis]